MPICSVLCWCCCSVFICWSFFVYFKWICVLCLCNVSYFNHFPCRLALFNVLPVHRAECLYALNAYRLFYFSWTLGTETLNTHTQLANVFRWRYAVDESQNRLVRMRLALTLTLTLVYLFYSNCFICLRFRYCNFILLSAFCISFSLVRWIVIIGSGAGGGGGGQMLDYSSLGYPWKK